MSRTFRQAIQADVVMLRTATLAIGTALLVILIWRLGPQELLAALGTIGWYFALILPLYAAHHATRALALRTCVLPPVTLRYIDAVAIRLSGEAVQVLTVTGPLLAEPTRAWLLRRRGLTLTEGFAATISEYLVSLFVNAAMAIAALGSLVAYFHPAARVSGIAVAVICAAAAFLIVSAMAITRRSHLIGAIIAGLTRMGLLRGRWRPDMSSINRMEDVLLAFLRDRPRRLVATIAIEAVAQAFLVLELLGFLHALNLAVPVSHALMIEGSTKVIGLAFVFIPLQLGVAEGAYAVIFAAMGLPPAAGFTLAFVRRVRTIVVASVGLPALARLMRDRPQH
jgi:hypothetical protein